MDQRKAPIFEKLLHYRDTSAVRFHVPGHKGRVMEMEEASVFQTLFDIDVTEISGMDDLHRPTGVILEAQQLAAHCFGAEESLFLVGGSTVGNLSMILGVCGADDVLIADRQVHKSVLHGIMLSGARVVFLPVHVIDGHSFGVTIADIDEALMRHPEAKGVLLTYPNYFGCGLDMARVIELVHACDKLVLVDEAHGVHFGFHPSLPSSSAQLGADAVVQSMHKMGNALTMGAILHFNGERIARAAVKQYAAMLQSSSPSYPLMASMDVCRRTLALQGHALIEQAMKVIRTFREEMTRFPWFGLSGMFDLTGIADQEEGARYCQDPMKIAVWDRTGALSGKVLQEALETQECMIEMSDPDKILLVFSMFSTQADAAKLLEAFAQVSTRFGLRGRPLRAGTGIPAAVHAAAPQAPVEPIQIPKYGKNPGEDKLGKNIQPFYINLEEAGGFISAEMVIPYPPGIPVLFRGERITKQAIDLLIRIRDARGNIQGLSDAELKRIQVWPS